MAVIDYYTLVAGSVLTWTSSGGSKVLTFTSVGDGAARQGDKSATLLDATLGMPELLEIVAEAKVQSAPTDGKSIDIYLGWSNSATAGTFNPGGLGGADASLSSPGSVVPLLHYVGSIICSNAIGTGIQRQAPFLVTPRDICFIPVAFNNSGQTASATGTDFKITVTPWYRQRQA